MIRRFVTCCCLTVVLGGIPAKDVRLYAQATADSGEPGKLSDESTREEIDEEAAQAKVAYTRFLSLLQRQPRLGTSLDRVYSFHLEQGTLEEFMTSLRERASSANDNGVSWMLLGLFELRRGRDSEAASALRESEDLRRSDPLVSWYLGQCLVRLGQATAATEAYERAIEKSPDRNDLIQIFQELGRAYRRSQQPEKASEIWRRMEEQFPQDLRVKEQIATILQEEGDFESALNRFSELAALQKDSYQASQSALTVGELKLQLGRTEEALRDFEKQLGQLDPDSWLSHETRRRIEDVFLRHDDVAGLVGYYESWLKSHPEDLEAMTCIGRVLSKQGRSQDAQSWYAKALERAPSNVALREALIDQLIREDQIAEAIAQYEQLRKYDNGNADHVEEWGLLYLNRRDLPQDEQRASAARVWKLLLEDRPDDPVTMIRVAELLRRAESIDKAIEHFRRAISLAPEEPQYREYFGDYLHSLNRKDEAFAIWYSIAEGELRTTDNLMHLAQVLQNHGEKERALEAMKDACELTPTFSDRIRYATMLREYETDNRNPRAEESLGQLELAEQMAESAGDRQLVLDERILSLVASGLLEQKTQELAAELQNGNNVTAIRWRTLAHYYEAARQLPSAMEAMKNSLAMEPESVSSWKVAANLYEKAGRNADAVEANRRLAKLDRRFLMEYLQKIATLEQKLGRMKEALQAGKDLIAAAPGNPEHLQFYADLCFQVGQKEEGLNTLRRAVRTNSTDENAVLSLASALANQSETTEAMELYWRVFERTTDPDMRTAVISSLAELHLRTNQFDRLVKKLELRGKELNQQRDSAICLATAFRIAGDLQSARRQLERLLTADSRDVTLLSELSKLTEEEGDLDAAADYQRRINSAAPSDEGRVRLAGLLLKLGDISEAEALWVRVSETKAAPHEVFRSIDQLIEMESVDSARELCDRILQREPDNWEALVRLGVVEWNYGQKDKALELFDKLLSLQLDLDTLSAEMAWNTTNPQLTKTSQTSDHELDAPPACMRNVRSYLALILLNASDQAEVGNPQLYFGGTTQVSEIMPSDFGEARIVCLAAQLLKAHDEEGIPVFLDQLEVNAESSSQAIWDVLYIDELLSEVGIELPNDHQVSLAKTLQLSTRLAESGATDGQFLYLMACVEVLNGIVEEERVGPHYTAEGPGQLSSDHVALMIESFESVLSSHPEWLAVFDYQSLLTGCDQIERPEWISALVSRLNTEKGSRAQLQAALELSLLLRDTGTDDALELLDRIAVQTGQFDPANSSSESALPWLLVPLMKIANQAAENSDHDSVLKTLDWWLKYKATDSSHGTPTVTSAQTTAAAQRIVNQTIAPDREEGLRIQISGHAQGEVEGLGIQHHFGENEIRYLAQIDDVFVEAERHDELLTWCQQRGVGADADTVVSLDLTQAVFCWKHEYVPEAIVHLIHAAELAPNDILLRLKLVELTEFAGQKAEALALLDLLPDSDPVLLKALEIKALDLAMKVNNKDRAQSAAERLYGLQLDPTEEEFLISKLNALGLRELAAQVKARSRTVTSKAHTLTPMELLDQYEKQGNTQAAAQIAQQLIRRTTATAAATSASSRFPSNSNVEDIRKRAFQVLKTTGELEKMIERQKAQLEKSPNSKLLLQTLAEYLDQADKSDEASAIRDRITPHPNGNPSAAIISAAERFKAAGRNGEACDKYLELMNKHPHTFWENFFEFEKLLVEEKRTQEIVDAIITDEHRKARHRLGVLRQQIFIAHLIDDETLLPVVAELLKASFTANPEHSTDFINSVGEHAAWQTPEMFAVLSELYVPKSAAEAKQPRLGWAEEYEESGVALDVTTDATEDSDGDLAILFGALVSHERRAEFRIQVMTAKKAFPEWQGADMFLTLIEMRSDISGVNADRLIRQWIDHPQRPIPEPVARNVAALLETDARLKPLAIELLKASLLQSQPNDIDFVAPAARMLTRLYAETGQLETGREFILQHLPAQSDGNPNPKEKNLNAIGSRLAAAHALIDLSFPLDALKVVDGLTAGDVEQYLMAVDAAADQSSKSQAMLKSILSDAGRALTPLEVASELNRTPNPTDPSVRPLLDLVLQLYDIDNGVESLESETLNSIPKRPKGGWEKAELRQLADSLEMALRQENADPSLVIVGAHFLLTSQDESEIAKVTPALEAYLSRPDSPLSEEDAAAPHFLRRHGIAMGFACVAAAIKDRRELAPLAGKMLDRSIAIARQFSDRRYLSALLYQRGEMLNAAGDKQAAEASWSEMLELVLAEPDENIGSGESGIRSSSQNRPAVDIGAELRKTLLKPSP